MSRTGLSKPATCRITGCIREVRRCLRRLKEEMEAVFHQGGEMKAVFGIREGELPAKTTPEKAPADGPGRRIAHQDLNQHSLKLDDSQEIQIPERTQELKTVVRLLQEANRRLEELNGALLRANEWLANAHEYMHSILNQLQIGVIIINGEGRVSFLSQAAERVLDGEHSHALGQPWEKLFPLEEEDKYLLGEEISLGSNENRRIPIQWVSGEGRRFWMEIEVRKDPLDSANRILFFYDVSEVADLRNLLNEMAQSHGLCGQSKAMQLVYRDIQAVARVETTVLIEGETGTGKELVARAIHYSSPRRAKPFLAINCAGLSESLLGSQLFGHRKGSFTGAVADQVGLFEAADGGTLFLDEVGDIPIPIQSSLLRVLQEKEITRLGDTRPLKVDVRIVAATNRDLSQEVASGHFRQDLFYRIRVAKIGLPPLREHREDVELLVAWLLGETCRAMNLPEPEVSCEAMAQLKGYRWPGNVRELKSAIEWALIRSDGAVIVPKNLPFEIIGTDLIHAGGVKPDEREQISEALQQAKGNRTEAARLLGVSRATLYRHLGKLNSRRSRNLVRNAG